MNTEVITGDALAVLKELPSGFYDAIVTDPPYGLEFMGRDWDTYRAGARIRRPSGRDAAPGAAHNASTSLVARNSPDAYVAGTPYQAWVTEWARECLRVLKPGGHLAAFGGTRTYHRLACGIEDAGFEIRDSVDWIFGTGFPKSHDVSKAVDRLAGAEREVTGERVYAGGRFRRSRGTDLGIINDDGWHGGTGPRADTAPATPGARAWDGWGTALKPAHEPIVLARRPLAGTVAANVLEHGTGGLNIDAARVPSGDTLVRPFIRRDDNDVYGKGLGAGTQTEPPGRWPPNVLLSEEAAGELDRQSGTREGGSHPPRRGADRNRTAYGAFRGQDCLPGRRTAPGGASRFFPVFRYQPKAPARERPKAEGVPPHPTVKPVELIRWLTRLVTPPGGTVLDPFAGTGTTAQACLEDGFGCTLVEQDEGYTELIRVRLENYGDVMFRYVSC